MSRYTEIYTDKGCFRAPYNSCSDIILGPASPAQPYVEQPPPPLSQSTRESLRDLYLSLSDPPYTKFHLTGDILKESSRAISEAEQGFPINGSKLSHLHKFLNASVFKDGRDFEGFSHKDQMDYGKSLGVDDCVDYYIYDSSEECLLTPEQGRYVAWWFRKALEIIEVKDVSKMDPLIIIEDWLQMKKGKEAVSLDDHLRSIFAGNK